MRTRLKRAALLVASFLVVTVVMLWSWNTLAELFAAPEAQYRHALAAAALIVVGKWTVFGGGRGFTRRPRHGS